MDRNGEAAVLFNASSADGAGPVMGDHYATDGPFVFRSQSGRMRPIFNLGGAVKLPFLV